MTYWKTLDGIIGHAPAHIMDEAIDEIRECYRLQLGREPSKREICHLTGYVLAAIDDMAYFIEPPPDGEQTDSTDGDQGDR